MSGHYYDWGPQQPHTDNPRHAGKLTRGLHNHVYVSGVEVSKVLKYQTGEDGWVERYATDRDGRLVEEPEGEFKRETLRGFVVFVIDKATADAPTTPSPRT